VKIRRVKTRLDLGQGREPDSPYLPERRDPKLKLNIRALHLDRRDSSGGGEQTPCNARLFKHACSPVGKGKRTEDRTFARQRFGSNEDARCLNLRTRGRPSSFFTRRIFRGSPSTDALTRNIIYVPGPRNCPCILCLAYPRDARRRHVFQPDDP